MGSKIKPRQLAKPRNHVVMDMILNTKGGPMRDRRDRRLDERARRYENENENESDEDDYQR